MTECSSAAWLTRALSFALCTLGKVKGQTNPVLCMLADELYWVCPRVCNFANQINQQTIYTQHHLYNYIYTD